MLLQVLQDDISEVWWQQLVQLAHHNRWSSTTQLPNLPRTGSIRSDQTVTRARNNSARSTSTDLCSAEGPEAIVDEEDDRQKHAQNNCGFVGRPVNPSDSEHEHMRCFGPQLADVHCPFLKPLSSRSEQNRSSFCALAELWRLCKCGQRIAYQCLELSIIAELA